MKRRRLRRQAAALLALGNSAPRQVGICGSCLGPVMLNPDAAQATCPCGHCVLPRGFLRYGELTA